MAFITNILTFWGAVAPASLLVIKGLEMFGSSISRSCSCCGTVLVMIEGSYGISECRRLVVAHIITRFMYLDVYSLSANFGTEFFVKDAAISSM